MINFFTLFQRPLQRKDWGNWKIPTFSDAEKAAKKAKEWTEKAAKKAKEETEKAAKKAKEETEKKAKEAKELAEKAIKETQKLQAKITNLAGKFLGTTQEVRKMLTFLTQLQPYMFLLIMKLLH